jgi:hypothetical protein
MNIDPAASVLRELEGEFESECECEGEYEGEFEDEADAEAEEFLSTLAGLARGVTRNPALRATLRRAGLAAARSALRGLGDLGAAAGGAVSPAGARLGRDLGAVTARNLLPLLPQRESELELEGEWEDESLLNPIRRVYSDALMEHMAHAAAGTESEAEAEAFLGALIPLAARAIPAVAPTILRAAPALIRGVSGIAQTLMRNPGTRPLVRTLPTIVRRTATALARRQQPGRSATPAVAARTLAGQAARLLSDPAQCARAIRQSRSLDATYHRVTGYPRTAQRRRTPCPRCGS